VSASSKRSKDIPIVDVEVKFNIFYINSFGLPFFLYIKSSFITHHFGYSRMMMTRKRKKFLLLGKGNIHLLRSQLKEDLLLKRIRSKRLKRKRSSKSLKLKRPQRQIKGRKMREGKRRKVKRQSLWHL
jgi:hypothetical protein